MDGDRMGEFDPDRGREGRWLATSAAETFPVAGVVFMVQHLLALRDDLCCDEGAPQFRGHQ